MAMSLIKKSNDFGAGACVAIGEFGRCLEIDLNKFLLNIVFEIGTELSSEPQATEGSCGAS